jgi:hypothetical protein
MFVIDNDMTMHITRGDTVVIAVRASVDGTEYTFRPYDIVRLKVFEKKDCAKVVLEKDTRAEEEKDVVEVTLTKEDTTIGEVISKPVDYWYEVELNPETDPQTIVGYDEDGAKVFRLYPEGGVANE